MEMHIRLEGPVAACPRDLPEGFSLRQGVDDTDVVLVGAVADTAERRRVLLRIHALGLRPLSVGPA